jgi:CHAT domain/NACHT domain
MQFKNIDIEVFNAKLVPTADNRRVGSFQVRVKNSPAGEMKIEQAVAIEYDDKQLQATLQQLENRALDRAGLVKLGSALAGWMLPPKQAGANTGVLELYKASLDGLQQDMGLRLRLMLPPQIAALPWEYMYIDPAGGGDGIDGFLALNGRVAIVRYEEINAPPLSPATTGNVKVLVALASAPGFAQLNLAQEKTDLQQALNEQSSLNQVSYLDDAKLSDVQSHIAGAGVFHFSGHGAFTETLGSTPGTYDGTGSLAFEDKTVDAEQVGVLLNGNSVRLAVLGACETGRSGDVNTWSGVAQQLVKQQVPAVVANQFTILDQCAIAFHQQFYNAALVAGLSIEEAVTAGRKAAYLTVPDGREWGVAVLYLRADDGHLFGGASDPGVRDKAKENIPGIGSTQTWGDLLQSSKDSFKHLRGTVDRPAPFIPDLYVHRTDDENTLKTFLNSDASAIILVGDSGIGKTNLLCSWMATLQEEGHVTFYYNGVVFTKAEVEPEVSRDLSPKDPNTVTTALERVSSLAANQGQQCVLIFDAISEFRGENNAGPETLLKNINTFVTRLPTNVRVVLSCRTSTWNRLDPDTQNSFQTPQYFTPAKGAVYLRVELFTPPLFEQAYGNYAHFFQLQTPVSELPTTLRERLRFPLLLRMLAEAYHNQPVAYQNLALGIFRQFYEERVSGAKALQDQLFINKLAALMLSQQRGALAETELAGDNDLGPYILGTDPAKTSYTRLVDNGILTIAKNDRLPGSLGNMVRFTYDQLGGYILALYLLQQPDITPDQKIPELIQNIQKFTLAWYASQALLILNKDAKLYSAIAQNPNIELRELVVESLVELHADEQATALDIIKQLLQNLAQEVQRTGLKAAYSVNPRARDIFLWAAIQNTPALPQLTRDILYLVWRNNAAFPYDLLHELTGQINLTPLTLIDSNAMQEIKNTVQFVFDLLVTIYINNCEQDYVIQQTCDIFFELTVTRLHLDKLNTGFLGPLGPSVEKFLVERVTAFFTKPLIDAFLYNDRVPAHNFFDLPPAERARLKDIAPYLDPRKHVAEVKDELDRFLKSDVMLFNLMAALVLSIHAYHDFATTKPLLQSLFETQGTQGQGRLWILNCFVVLLPGTPPEWVELVEEFTRRLIEEQSAIFYGDEQSIFKLIDMALLPLGLAYGKRGDSMPYIETLIRNGLQQNDMRLVQRCVEALGTVGFYYPKAVFHTLGTTLPDAVTRPDLQPALIHTLATMRVLFFDDVDNFLRQLGADETLQRSVSAATDVDLVSRTIHLLGLYNNAVHYTVFYPLLRQRLGMSALNILAEATTPGDFVTRYTLESIHLTQETDFQLKTWTGLD